MNTETSLADRDARLLERRSGTGSEDFLRRPSTLRMAERFGSTRSRWPEVDPLDEQGGKCCMYL